MGLQIYSKVHLEFENLYYNVSNMRRFGIATSTVCVCNSTSWLKSVFCSRPAWTIWSFDIQLQNQIFLINKRSWRFSWNHEISEQHLQQCQVSVSENKSFIGLIVFSSQIHNRHCYWSNQWHRKIREYATVLN